MMLYPNDYDAVDTILERQLRETTVNLRAALYELRDEVDSRLERLDKGQRPTSSLFPGRVVDASKVNGYGGMLDALLNIPWGHDDFRRIADADRADEIIRTAGKRG